ncbi:MULTISPECIES: kanamycin nucleotidyltransferase C-terminal domain-containing protein [Planococcus]|uniref:KNTase domain-containing protein n=1 Tax=Planococcus faecalis TaxID=1598147 RepID=A0ABM6IRV6_9BACL|nr:MULTISPECIES: kanamycin nucleotidyltransferase C-terminal domain-containing protein [Planococcus]AQU79327.1 KNTase domain-containing protein [Planococcus faecalis]MDJ0333083.1 kanamycin nucleotidyltransferase C-terminal domain-containing protein [Planococcus sp. S3-L1]
MLTYPVSTTRSEKLEMIAVLKDRLLAAYGEQLLAIGVYGSIALETEGPYSDIEMHVVTKEYHSIEDLEFVYDKFKIEIGFHDKQAFFEKAKKIDDAWAIKAGAFIHVLPVYDPTNLFEQVKCLPFEGLSSSAHRVMKEFMVGEPYETMAKIRNSYHSGNHNYIPLGANDLVWETAKLIGLANHTYYSTRAKTYEESVRMKSVPTGYRELVQFVMNGQLTDTETVYQLCESLWTGLNRWMESLGLNYRLTKLPF